MALMAAKKLESRRVREGAYFFRPILSAICIVVRIKHSPVCDPFCDRHTHDGFFRPFTGRTDVTQDAVGHDANSIADSREFREERADEEHGFSSAASSPINL